MSEVLSGRYELGAVLGSGGMGAVYEATDLRLGRQVAVKVLRGGPLADEVARSRMRSEAMLAASIHHPGVAQVFDLVEDDSAHTGASFIVMELVRGHTLAQLLHECGTMPPDQVMSVVVQVANGLEAAHAAGIVHRDLKPANIMLTPAGRTVLVDFGIARSASSEPLTNTGVMVGTADYMSPEQAAGRSATAQSDLYSLGVVAYHCLTGSSPFRRESPVAAALAQLNDDLPPLPDGVPGDVADLVVRLTEKAPSRRPATAAEVAGLASAIGASVVIDLPTTFEPPVVDAPAVASESTAALPPVVPSVRSSRRRPAVYAGAGALILALGLAGVQTMGDDADRVPKVVGMDVRDATARLRDGGMTVSSESVDLAGKPAGQVVRQTPGPGGTVEDGDPVELVVATGKVKVSAGEVIGLTYAKASAALEERGLQVRREDIAQAAGAGTVTGIDRSGRLSNGSVVTLTVAVAPPAMVGPSESTSGNGTSGSSGTPKAKSKSKSKGKSGK